MNNRSILGKKFLITGASGFIGKHVCNQLIKSGAIVYGITRKDNFASDNKMIWCRTNIVNGNKVEDLFAAIKPQIVMHLASQITGSRDIKYVKPLLRNNLITTINVLTAARKTGCEKVILAGSMEEPLSNHERGIPNSPYSAAKLASSIYGKMFHKLYNLPVVILKIFMVYGPGQMDLKKLIPYAIVESLRGNSPRFSSGKRKIDWIYVDDVVDGFIAAALANGVEGETVDIGSGNLVSIRRIVGLLMSMIDPTIKPLFGALADRTLERIHCANIDESYKLIGWKPKMELQKGLKLTVDWYQAKLEDRCSS